MKTVMTFNIVTFTDRDILLIFLSQMMIRGKEVNSWTSLAQ